MLIKWLYEMHGATIKKIRVTSNALAALILIVKHQYMAIKHLKLTHKNIFTPHHWRIERGACDIALKMYI